MIVPGQSATRSFLVKIAGMPVAADTLPVGQVFVDQLLTAVPVVITNGPNVGEYFVTFTAAAGWTTGQNVKIGLTYSVSGTAMYSHLCAGQVEDYAAQLDKINKNVINYGSV